MWCVEWLGHFNFIDVLLVFLLLEQRLGSFSTLAIRYLSKKW